MAVTVGTDSYILETDADAYFLNLGKAEWATATADNREIALKKACSYMEAEYDGRWVGKVTSLDQVLAWPRYGVQDLDGRCVSSNGYPNSILKAQCELALKALTVELMVDVAAGEVGLVEKKTGPLTKKWGSGVYSPKKKHTYVDALLRPFVCSRKNYLVRG